MKYGDEAPDVLKSGSKIADNQYEVVGEFTKIEEYISNCTDINLKTQIDAIVTKYYDGDYS